MTDVPDELPGSIGEHLLPTESLKLDKKPCFRADTPVEEFVYCKIPSNHDFGISEESLVLLLSHDQRAERFGFNAGDIQCAVTKLIMESWITRPKGEGMLYRTNFERSICLQWL
jgi:hypothetical protein